MAADTPQNCPPALLSVVETLGDHSAGVRAAAFTDWLEGYASALGEWAPPEDHCGVAFEAGWRRALEWYIALARHAPGHAQEVIGALEEPLEVHDGRQCGSPPECGRLDAEALRLLYHELGYWCHAPAGHRGDHQLGH